MKIIMPKAIAVSVFAGAKGDYVTFADGEGMVKLSFDGHVEVPKLEPLSVEAEVRGQAFGQNQSLVVMSHSIKRLSAVAK